MRHGSLRYPKWLALEQRLRSQLATLIGAPSADDIALLKNTSEALSFVAGGLDWADGDNIVSSDQEFPSNRIVWESLAGKGVTLRQADLDSATSPEAALMAQVDDATRMIAVSSVQYGSGLRLDLRRLGEFCAEHGILFCVDAIQSVGAESIDVVDCQIDFLAADGHKWMLGPEGLALFYCRAGLRKRLQLNEFGWHMVEAIGEFEQRTWQPAASARRFECGSPNMLAIHALEASLTLLLELGMESVERLLRERIDVLFARLAGQQQITIITPREPKRHLGIFTFRYCDRDNGLAFQRLTNAGLFCAERGGGIRLSPHFHTPYPELEKAIALIIQPPE